MSEARRGSHVAGPPDPDGPARRGSHASGGGPRKRWPLVTSLVAALLVVGGGAGFLTVHRLQGNIHTEDLTPRLGASRPSAAPTDAEGGRPVNVLVMGSDSREGANGFIGGVKDGARSDTAMVLHLSADRTWAAGVSIPRDSVVDVPDCVSAKGTTVPGSRRMFNDAFTTGGPACTQKTVESLTGIRIDHYVVVDFAGFKNIVDALGTVPICLPQAVDDPKHGIHLPAGRSEVDGKTALAYVRERYKLGDGGDLGRIDRQQAFLSSVLQEATSAGTLTNPVRLYAFLDAATRSLTMDPQLSSLPTLTGFAREVQAVGLSRIRFLTIPVAEDPQDTNRLVWTAQAATVWKALRTDTPLTTSAAKGAAAKGATAATAATAKATKAASPSSAASTSAASPSPDSVALQDVRTRTADTSICS